MSNTLSASGWLNAFRTEPSLAQSSRLALSGTRDQRISAAEIALLLGCGALAAAAVGMLHLRMGVPGHAILRAVLPMAMGLALVPRRSGGTIMAAGAGLTSAAMSAAQIGVFQPAAMLSVLALGPVLDLALLGKPQGWRLYARFAAAGALANMLAYIVKIATVQLGWSAAGGRQFLSFGIMALISFVLCGALAGLVSAAICFRSRVADDLRRD